MKRKAILFSILMSIIFLSSQICGDTDITVNGTSTFQSIYGFEIALLGVKGNPSGFYGIPYADIAQQLVNNFGNRIFRIRENLSDFEPVNDDTNPLSFNWSVYNATFSQPEFVSWFQNVRDMHNAGAEICLVPFHAPQWMTDTNSGDLRYSLKDDYPRPDLYQEIAETWAAILVHLKTEYHVDVKYLSIWNEPIVGEPFKFTQKEFIETLKAVGQRFEADSLKTRILITDASNIGKLLPIVHQILNDTAIVKYTEKIAYHPYDTWPDREHPDKLVPYLKTLADDTTISATGFDLWMTEWAIIGDVFKIQAIAGAKHIYNCHVFGRTSVVDQWYIGPWGDPSNIIEPDSQSTGFQWRKQAFAWKQYAKFIDTGSVLIDVTPKVESGTSTPAISAYLHATTERLTLVAINRDSLSNKTINVSLQNIKEYDNLVVYRTSASENCDSIETIAVSDNSFSFDLPTLSITTFTGIPSTVGIKKQSFSFMELNNNTLKVHSIPFSPSVKISYYLQSNSNVSIDIYNVNGRLLRNLFTGKIDKGSHSIFWDGRSSGVHFVGKGIYLIRLCVNDKVLTSSLINIE